MTKIRVLNRKIVTPEGSPNANLVNSSRGDGAKLTYRPFTKCGGNDEYVDSQFQRPPVRIPKKSILLATFLFVFGSCLLCVAIMSVLRDHQEALYADRIIPMLVIGALMFIPGFYHVRIAYLAFLGVAGYNFDDIPEFE